MPRARGWAGVVVLAALAKVSPVAAEAPATAPPAAGAPAAKPKLAFFPLPMYTTVPNEGSTYGVMPVLLRTDTTERVRWILAPSVSWNRSAGVNGTFRYYNYPSTVRWWSIVAAASTKVNRTLWLEYWALPEDPGDITVELVGQIRRNIFYRFFGLGPDTPKEGESSYTRLAENLTGRVGLNLPGHFNAGVRFVLRHDHPLRYAILGLPLTQDAYPDAPGLGGATVAAAGASLRYDTREGRDYAESGVAVDVTGSYAHGLEGFDHFWQGTVHARALVPEASFLQGAGRLYWTDQSGGRAIPFFYQSALGGEVLLRGFPEGRFVDRGAWEVEFEQRIRLLRTHMFHVVTEWRVDPFIAVGQVYPQFGEMFSQPRLAGGLGLRAWVKPNVLGRVDVAYSSEGLRAYVVLGYPY
jgi:hypothetical protein